MTTRSNKRKKKSDNTSKSLPLVLLPERFDDFVITSEEDLRSSLDRTLVIKFDDLGMSLRVQVSSYSLATRSAYFKKLFHTMSEKDKKTIEIQAIPSQLVLDEEEEKHTEGLVNPYYLLSRAYKFMIAWLHTMDTHHDSLAVKALLNSYLPVGNREIAGICEHVMNIGSMLILHQRDEDFLRDVLTSRIIGMPLNVLVRFVDRAVLGPVSAEIMDLIHKNYGDGTCIRLPFRSLQAFQSASDSDYGKDHANFLVWICLSLIESYPKGSTLPEGDLDEWRRVVQEHTKPLAKRTYAILSMYALQNHAVMEVFGETLLTHVGPTWTIQPRECDLGNGFPRYETAWCGGVAFQTNCKSDSVLIRCDQKAMLLDKLSNRVWTDVTDAVWVQTNGEAPDPGRKTELLSSLLSGTVITYVSTSSKSLSLGME